MGKGKKREIFCVSGSENEQSKGGTGEVNSKSGKNAIAENRA